MNPDFCAGIFAGAFLVIAGMGVWCAVEDIRTRKAETRQLQRENDRLDKIVARAEGCTVLDATDRTLLAKFLRSKARTAEQRNANVIISASIAQYLDQTLGGLALSPSAAAYTITVQEARDFADALDAKEGM